LSDFGSKQSHYPNLSHCHLQDTNVKRGRGGGDDDCDLKQLIAAIWKQLLAASTRKSSDFEPQL
jgi:hypothetical protein